MTNQLAVLGDPVAHSLSPQIHGAFAAQTGIDLHYAKQRVDAADFNDVVKQFFADGGKGLNVTVPHKHLAFQLADEVSPEAKAAQAVNTLFMTASGQLRGENTDGYGLLRDIAENLQWTISGKRILLLGAGGAAQGVIANLLAAEPAQLVIANRTLAKAEDLVQRFADNRFTACAMSELLEEKRFDVIISASSGGLSSDAEATDAYLPEQLKDGATCCYDMIYGKDTPFLIWANHSPAAASSDGLGMLVEQAAKAFELWFGESVNTRPVLDDIRATLSLKD